MADKGKKAKNKKATKVKMNLDDFLGDVQPGSNMAVVSLDWAAAMDDVEINNPPEPYSARVVLPTAPKSVRGPSIDFERIPKNGPFKAYLGNLSYEVDESDIRKFFSNLNLKDVQLPRGGDRMRGFGYAEFHDRESLISALGLSEEKLKGRPIKVNLADDTGEGRGGNRGDREHRNRESETTSDWRAAPRESFTASRGEPARNGTGGYEPRQRSYGPPSDGFDSGPRRGFNDADKTFGGPRRGEYDYDRSGPRRTFGTGFGPGRDDYSRPSNNFSDEPAERPRLNLLPRTRPKTPEEPINEGPIERKPLKLLPRSLPREPLDIAPEKPTRSELRDEHVPPPREPERIPLREEQQPEPPRPESPKERPKLKLQPRSKPKEETVEPVGNSAIFGGAKPVDTLKRELEIEERLLKLSSETTPDSGDERVRRISTTSSVTGSVRGSRRSSESERAQYPEAERERPRRQIDYDRGYDPRRRGPPPPSNTFQSNRRIIPRNGSDRHEPRRIINEPDAYHDRRPIRDDRRGYSDRPPVRQFDRDRGHKWTRDDRDHERDNERGRFNEREHDRDFDRREERHIDPEDLERVYPKKNVELDYSSKNRYQFLEEETGS